VFDVGRKEVGLRAKKEDWVKRKDVYKKASDEFLEDKALQIVRTKQEHLKVWRLARIVASMYLDDLKGRLSLNRTHELLTIARCMKVITDGERTVFDLPTKIAGNSSSTRASVPVTLTTEEIAEMDAILRKHGCKTK